jgi:hypothetical protein
MHRFVWAVRSMGALVYDLKTSDTTQMDKCWLRPSAYLPRYNEKLTYIIGTVNSTSDYTFKTSYISHHVGSVRVGGC